MEIISNILGQVDRVHSGERTITDVGGVELLDAVTKVSWGVNREGADHVFAQGHPEAFAQTEGNIKPEDSVITIYASKLAAFESAFSRGGPVGSSTADITIKHFDTPPSIGVTALEAARLAPVLIQLVGCTWQGYTSSPEKGAVTIDVKVKPTRVRPNGKALVLPRR